MNAKSENWLYKNQKKLSMYMKSYKNLITLLVYTKEWAR